MWSNILTQDVLKSEMRSWQGIGWRIIECQSQISTMKVVANIDEQKILEEIVETTKPNIPTECQKLHYLFYTPFRYSPYPADSRFRRKGSTNGVWYSSENVKTAVSEAVFYQYCTFAESPEQLLPNKNIQYTAIPVRLNTANMLDLTSGRLAEYSEEWTHLDNYEPCLKLADLAQKAGVEVIRYTSVRDSDRGRNLAVISCNAFESANPLDYQTWNIKFDKSGALAECGFPMHRIEFSPDAFSPDSRLKSMNWRRKH